MQGNEHVTGRPNRPATTGWDDLTGGTGGRDYAARFAALAAGGRDMHGEATFCASLLEPAARVLDAGCGAGRVAIRLAELGFDCVGVDVDESMLEVAREAAPDVPWFRADLAALTAADLGDGDPFDLVVVAGNVIPLLAPGTVGPAGRALCGLLRPGGWLVAGFGLDPARLPPGCPVNPLSEYDDACSQNGLDLVDPLLDLGPVALRRGSRLRGERSHGARPTAYLDPGGGGPENDFTNRNTTFMTWNLMHLAKMLKDAEGVRAYGNQRSAWDAGSRFD